MIDTSIVKVDDLIKFKKNHPCGGNIWQVLRIGIDYKLECTTCHRIILIARLEVAKKAKEVVKQE